MNKKYFVARIRRVGSELKIELKKFHPSYGNIWTDSFEDVYVKAYATEDEALADVVEHNECVISL